jgi:glycosyltransferase involved in cell wall biosynthesis/SAM-dependent methyltransferase
MTISVLIPAYNSARTIQATLASVLSQTDPPGEIIVLDDGSTDQTVALLGKYAHRITLLQQQNSGVAHARNALAERAKGDLLAFLDHDDIWHPHYLAAQRKSFADYPDAVAFFCNHQVFAGFGGHEWSQNAPDAQKTPEIINGVEFLERYHNPGGKFGSMSFCCVPKDAMRRLGPQPFHPEIPGADDYYLCHTLMLLGPVVFNPSPLVAYRISPGAQSANLLKSVEKAVRSLELLESRFREQPNPGFGKVFGRVFAAKRREYGRVLMGTGRAGLARRQFSKSMSHSYHPLSLAKSLVWLCLACVPRCFQPKLPGEWKANNFSGTGQDSGKFNSQGAPMDIRNEILDRLKDIHVRVSHPYYLHYRSLFSDLRKASCHAHGKMLDVGCGNKPFRELFAAHVKEHVGCDVVQSSEHLVDIICPATALAVPDEECDTVLCTQVIEHVADHGKMLSEAYRVLRGGGVLILSGPMYWPLHEEPYDFFRFTEHGLKYLLGKEGFIGLEIMNNGGKWALCGQVIVHTLLDTRFGRIMPLRLINRVFAFLDDLNPCPKNTMNYVVIARKPASH